MLTNVTEHKTSKYIIIYMIPISVGADHTTILKYVSQVLKHIESTEYQSKW